MTDFLNDLAGRSLAVFQIDNHMVYADLLQTVEQRNKVMPSQLIPQVDRPWWCLRVICQVEVK